MGREARAKRMTRVLAFLDDTANKHYEYFWIAAIMCPVPESRSKRRLLADVQTKLAKVGVIDPEQAKLPNDEPVLRVNYTGKVELTQDEWVMLDWAMEHMAWSTKALREVKAAEDFLSAAERKE